MKSSQDKISKNAVKNQLSPKKEESLSVRLIKIEEENAGQRVDNFLLNLCKGVPKSHIYRILRSGEVRVNRKRVNQTYKLTIGDEVRVPPIRQSEKDSKFTPAAEFKILYEDEDLLIIDKPSGRAVHGGSGISYGVIEQLRASRPESRFLELVHRLDKETSGILVLAKKRSALTDMHEQIRTGTVDKRYLTLVHGNWQNERQHVKLPLQKYSTADGERRVRVQADGQASHTVFNLLKKLPDYSLLEAELKTGRTHQIRVHLASKGFAIAGDDKYGDFRLNRDLQKSSENKTPFKRMFLHAHKITFTHPKSKEKITISAPLPEECRKFLDALETSAKKEKDNG